MRFILTRIRGIMYFFIVLAAAAGVAGGCGGDDEEKATSTPSKASPVITAAASPSPKGPGAAGIPSNPRPVAGLEGILTLDDGLAIFKERPASEDRTGVTQDKILLGRYAGASNPAIATYEAVWGPTIQALVKRINEAGGIHGRKLEVVTRDDQYNPAVTVQVVQELVEKDKVFALFFGVGNAPHQAIGEYVISKKVPELWTFDGNVKWAEPETTPTEFPGLFPDILEGVMQAQAILAEHPGAKVAAIYQNDALGQPFMEGFKPSLEKGGGQLVADVPFDVTASDMTSYVQQALDAKPDAITFYGSFTTALGTITAMRQTFGSTVPLYQRGALPNPQVNQALDGVENTRNTKSPYSDPNDPVWQKLQTFAKEEGIPYNETLSLLVLREFEHLVRALELAGPDLTREGLIQAIETGFDGSWTCSVCIAPTILGPQDHWSFEAAQAVRWNNAKGAYDTITPIVSFETSQGKGIRGNIPGYECKPDTCPWKQ